MRRKLPFFKTILLLGAILVVACICILVFARIDRVVIAEGHLYGGTAAVRAPWAGRIEEVQVKLGDTVKKGQTLFRLESTHLKAEEERISTRIETHEAHIQALREESERLVSDAHPAEIERAERNITRTQLECDKAGKHFELKKRLKDEGTISMIDYDDAELAYKLAQLALEEAKIDATRLQSEHPAQLKKIADQIREIEGNIAEEKVNLNEALEKISRCLVKAETQGVVLSDRLFELPGQVVKQGDELLRLAAGSADRFKGLLTDSGRAKARQGLLVKIRLDGYPWLIHGILPGRVEFVSDRREASGRFPVEISFDPSHPIGPLYEGMGGEARIVVEEKVSLGRLLLEKMVGKDEP